MLGQRIECQGNFLVTLKLNGIKRSTQLCLYLGLAEFLHSKNKCPSSLIPTLENLHFTKATQETLFLMQTRLYACHTGGNKNNTKKKSIKQQTKKWTTCCLANTLVKGGVQCHKATLVIGSLVKIWSTCQDGGMWCRWSWVIICYADPVSKWGKQNNPSIPDCGCTPARGQT